MVSLALRSSRWLYDGNWKGNSRGDPGRDKICLVDASTGEQLCSLQAGRADVAPMVLARRDESEENKLSLVGTGQKRLQGLDTVPLAGFRPRINPAAVNSRPVPGRIQTDMVSAGNGHVQQKRTNKAEAVRRAL
jgi:hypothetical protein